MIGFVKKIVLNYGHSYFIKKWNKLKVDQNQKPRLFFGTKPVLNYAYWSDSMKKMDYDSKTVMSGVLQINNVSDFDVVLENQFDEIVDHKHFKFLPSFIRKRFKIYFREYYLFDYVLKNFDIYHISYSGIGILGLKHWELEIDLIKKKGGKIIVLPFGSDWMRYSMYGNNTSFKHGLMTHYPEFIAKEEFVDRTVRYLNKKADVIVAGGNTISKVWHVLMANYIVVDIEKFTKRKEKSLLSKEKVVKIAHSPNHRFIKGTEYVIQAIDELNKEGYKVELLLLEKMKNDKVLRILCEEADILISQLLYGYALSAIEGMASGLPVIANMEDEEFDKRVFRRFSFLDECPILSGTPETVKERIKELIDNPRITRNIAEAGVIYVEKYHSEKTSQFLFEKLYDKIWKNNEVDISNLFHPVLKDSYNNMSPKVEHPLVNNLIPTELLKK